MSDSKNAIVIIDIGYLFMYSIYVLSEEKIMHRQFTCNMIP